MGDLFMFPKFLSDLFKPINEVVNPTDLVRLYQDEVNDIVNVLKRPGFKVNDNHKVVHLFQISSYLGRPAFSPPRTYTENELNDSRLDCLMIFKALEKRFEGICSVDIQDKIVDLAKKLHEHEVNVKN